MRRKWQIFFSPWNHSSLIIILLQKKIIQKIFWLLFFLLFVFLLEISIMRWLLTEFLKTRPSDDKQMIKYRLFHNLLLLAWLLIDTTRFIITTHTVQIVCSMAVFNIVFYDKKATSVFETRDNKIHWLDRRIVRKQPNLHNFEVKYLQIANFSEK